MLKEKEDEIRAVYERIERNHVTPSRDDITNLFKYYNEYIDGYPKAYHDEYCNSCRVTVLKAWRAYFEKADARRLAKQV